MDNTIIFLNQKDLAKRWGIATATLEKWRVSGKEDLRFCKISNRVRYHIKDIEAYEAKKFLKHTSEASLISGGSV